MNGNPPKEKWSSRLGVILDVAGSAVGLGNFLRFPGIASQYGSGAFMIAYFISLLLIGIPICWAEWTLGRHAGQKGFHSSPGILYALIRHPAGKSQARWQADGESPIRSASSVIRYPGLLGQRLQYSPVDSEIDHGLRIFNLWLNLLQSRAGPFSAELRPSCTASAMKNHR